MIVIWLDDWIIGDCIEGSEITSHKTTSIRWNNCPLLIAHCSLLIAHCSLLIAHCLLVMIGSGNNNGWGEQKRGSQFNRFWRYEQRRCRPFNYNCSNPSVPLPAILLLLILLLLLLLILWLILRSEAFLAGQVDRQHKEKKSAGSDLLWLFSPPDFMTCRKGTETSKKKKKRKKKKREKE